MTPRDLIAAARAAGFAPIHRSLTGSTLVWTRGDWRIEVTPRPDRYTEIVVLARTPAHRYAEVATLLPATAHQAWVSLSALGVLPSPTGAAA